MTAVDASLDAEVWTQRFSSDDWAIENEFIDVGSQNGKTALTNLKFETRVHEADWSNVSDDSFDNKKLNCETLRVMIVETASPSSIFWVIKLLFLGFSRAQFNTIWAS
ncbi:hypothetical protein L1987_33580 [Smallanthus sonchifolius]|uniref:Uncharacterized protein n=1 Tax=Smallanthus sonchifolius TaxID=185202 RepID=A0ACB9HQX4_9ASTR|nr:hypothetical protein L1987_33580 [Smallanthus sonchifolius]